MGSINLEMWKELEKALAKQNVGYSVFFENHNGVDEMMVNIDLISIVRDDLSETGATQAE